MATRTDRENSMRGAVPRVLVEGEKNFAREGSRISWTMDGNLDDHWKRGRWIVGGGGGGGGKRMSGRANSAGGMGIHLTVALEMGSGDGARVRSRLGDDEEELDAGCGEGNAGRVREIRELREKRELREVGGN